MTLALVSPGERDLGAEMVVPSVKHLPHKHANMSSVAQNTWKRLDMTAVTWISVWGKAMKMEGPQGLPATQACGHDEFSGPEHIRLDVTALTWIPVWGKSREDGRTPVLTGQAV